MEDHLIVNAFRKIEAMQRDIGFLNSRVLGLSEQLADIYKKIDKADQFLQQAQITDAKIDRLVSYFVAHKASPPP